MAAKFFYVLARGFHTPAAFEIGLPLRSLRQGFLRIFVERLGHDCDQVARVSVIFIPTPANERQFCNGAVGFAIAESDLHCGSGRQVIVLQIAQRDRAIQLWRKRR